MNDNTPAIVATTDHLTLSDQMEFAKIVTHRPDGQRGSSILPESYRDNPANVLIAVGLGQAMGLSPAESLYRIAVIKGKPSAGAELIAANVRKAGHKLRVRVQEEPPYASATIIRADDPDEPVTIERDMGWAQRMGLAGEPNYKKQPATMLSYRAITACARLACPEALYGVTYTPDEVLDGVGTASTPPPQQATAADFIEAEPVEQAEPEPDGITSGQQKKMGALMREVGITQREHALAYVNDTIGREVASRSELTKVEAGQVIDALEADQQQDDPGAPWPAQDALPTEGEQG